ncbi:MAG: rhodanese-like domain-containing protein [Candidatus Kapabacteria bacterium]|nr:rhodanese-like domain-containing protein [Candidatus Kapabacteria bacterium]
MKINKSILKEILFILVVSISIGVVYNYMLPKPLPLIYQKKAVSKLSDDAVFGKQESVTSKDGIEKIDGTTVTYEQMLKIISNDDFILIDARNPEYYKKSRIGNSINIFPYADESEVMNKILDLPQNKKILVYCDGGNCDSSHKIAEILLNFGFGNVLIYTGGWDEWSKKKGIK